MLPPKLAKQHSPPMLIPEFLVGPLEPGILISFPLKTELPEGHRWGRGEIMIGGVGNGANTGFFV